ncbi:MAG: vitamin-B12 independent methionine synthase [Candidatus Binatia bacterium]
MSEGGYEAISSRLFSTIKAQRLLLEYDNERSGTVEPIQDIPDDKFVVLGLVTTKKASLETGEELIRRISDAARYVPLERLGLSPQCGFSSSIIGNSISREDQLRKLELVVNTVHTVWA